MFNKYEKTNSLEKHLNEDIPKNQRKENFGAKKSENLDLITLTKRKTISPNEFSPSSPQTPNKNFLHRRSSFLNNFSGFSFNIENSNKKMSVKNSLVEMMRKSILNLTKKESINEGSYKEDLLKNLMSGKLGQFELIEVKSF